MQKIKLGLAVVMVACGGQTLDVGGDPGQGGSGRSAGGSAPTTGGGAGYASVGGSGGRGGIAQAGRGGGAGADIGAAGVDLSGGSGGRAAGGTGGRATGGTAALGGTGGLGGTAGSSIDEVSWPTLPTSDTDEALKSLIGVWEGDVEDFYLQPVLHVRIEITGATEHSLSGTVSWGTSPPPPPPTDPDAPYPSAETFPLQLGHGKSPDLAWEPVEGFPYSIRQGAARSGVARFSTWKNEPWREWCGLQPVFTNGAEPSCSPGDGFSWSSDMPDMCAVNEADGTTHSYPYIRCLCPQLCICDADACTSVPQVPRDFDLTLDAAGDVLTGPFTGSYPDHPDWAYHLVRSK